jgi:hypothetical protein
VVGRKRVIMELMQLLLALKGVHDLCLAVASSLFLKCMDEVFPGWS